MTDLKFSIRRVTKPNLLRDRIYLIMSFVKIFNSLPKKDGDRKGQRIENRDLKD